MNYLCQDTDTIPNNGDNGEWVERKNWKCRRMKRDKKERQGRGWKG